MNIKNLSILVGVVALIGAFSYYDIPSLVPKALTWIESLGVWAPVAFIGIYIFATVFFLPGFLLTVGAGLIFGVVWGSIYVSIASTLGAGLSFLIGRYLARSWVEEKINANPNFKSIDEALAKEGWKIVVLLRLSPIFPFNLLNYAFGVTKISFKECFFASWFGMILGTVMYVYLGSLAGDLASLGSVGKESSPAQWIVRIVGFLATIAVTLYVTKIAKKALSQKLENSAG